MVKLLALDKEPEAEWIYFSFPQSSTGSALTRVLTPITRAPVSAWKIYCRLYFSSSWSEGFCHLQWAESGDLTKQRFQFKNYLSVFPIKRAPFAGICFQRARRSTKLNLRTTFNSEQHRGPKTRLLMWCHWQREALINTADLESYVFITGGPLEAWRRWGT